LACSVVSTDDGRLATAVSKFVTALVAASQLPDATADETAASCPLSTLD